MAPFKPKQVSPKLKVLINDTPVPPGFKDDIIEVTLSDYLDGSASFVLTVNIWHPDKQEYKWIDEEILAEGNPLEILLGYAEKTEPLMRGEITGLEPQFDDTEVPTLEVIGYDRLHRFRRGRKTRTFVKMTDSQIAAKIAREYNLTPRVTDSEIKHEYLCQRNQSDIDFLWDRAQRIGFELNIEDGKLRFRRKANDGNEILELKYGENLRSFFPRLTTVGQVSELGVRGWDPIAKKAILSTATPSKIRSKMGGGIQGVNTAEQAFENRPDRLVDLPVFSMDEAKQIAEGMYNDVALEYISGEATAIGVTDIRAGRVVKLARLGKRFTGLYYVTSSTHRIDQDGYITKFSVQRSTT